MSTEQEHALVHVANNESMASIINTLADYARLLTEASERLDTQAENDRKLQGRIQAMEVKLNTVSAELEHRIVVLEERITAVVADAQHSFAVLEGQMEQARAQIEGLTLGMVTFSLDDASREKLKKLLRGGRQEGSDDPILPPEEGTSR